MSDIVRAALIQTTGITPREAMVGHQVELVREAVSLGTQIVCLQEFATGPYFCQVENNDWFDLRPDTYQPLGAP